MRIGLITDRYRPESRAAAVLATGLAEGLAARGHTVEVWTRGRGEERSPCRVHRLRPLTTSSLPFLRLLDQLSIILRLLWRCVCGRQPDAWFVYSPPLLYTLPPLLSRFVRGTPVVVNLHDLYPQAAIDLGILNNPLAVGLARLLERWLYRCASVLLVAAPGSVRILREQHDVPAARLALLWNWAEPFTPASPERLRRWREDWGADHVTVVLYAGLMGWAQDLDTVLEAARLLEPDPRLRFVLLGDGPQAARLRGAAQGRPNVILRPPVESEQYSEVIEAAELCLVPLVRSFRAPAVPGKVSAILAAGRPAVAAVPAENDTAALLGSTGAGIAVPAGDAPALAAALRELAADAVRRKEMGMRGQAWIAAHATRSAAVLQCERAIAESVKSGRKLPDKNFRDKDASWSPCSS